MTRSDFYCPVCGAMTPLIRKSGGQRELGHHKKLWCFKCKCERNMTEVRAKDFTLDHVMRSGIYDRS